MTNPNASMRLLLVYAIIIPVAIILGYTLTDPLNYGSFGFVGILMLLLAAPILIKWHYPIMVFGLTCPISLFFLPGHPPPQLWQAVVPLSLGIAIVERAMDKRSHFLSAPAMTMAMLFTIAMSMVTMKLTGGFHLHSVGGGMGGGKKYVTLWLGCATFFALASREIPKSQRRLYVFLFFLPAALSFMGDLLPFTPSPINYLELIFPPRGILQTSDFAGGVIRFTSLGITGSALMFFMVARYGLRNILTPTHPFRAAMFVGFFFVSMLGGYRAYFVADLLILAMVFVFEGLHRTRYMVIVSLIGLMFAGIFVIFPRELPQPVQRAISFLPVNINPIVRANAEASTEWRLRIWEAIMPEIPDYLWLGKGYSLSAVDYESMGPNDPFAASARANASLESLAISNDFHSGPLTTIICFGIWGCISILSIMIFGLLILYRNFRYGDADLRTVNALLLARHLEHILHFFFIFGSYPNDVFSFACVIGFSMALNGGVRRPKAKPAFNPVPKPKSLIAVPGTSSTPQPA